MGCPFRKAAGSLSGGIFIRYRSGLYNTGLATLSHFLVFDGVLVLAGQEHAVAHAARVVSEIDADVVGLGAERAVILMVGI